MIAMLIRNSWKQLRRDRGAQVLAFVVPIAFFSIFAVIFGPRGSSVTGTSRVAVAVADESNTPRSRALVEALAADSGLKVLTVWTGHAEGGTESGRAITRALAERLVKDGDVETALVLPAGIDPATRWRPRWSADCSSARRCMPAVEGCWRSPAATPTRCCRSASRNARCSASGARAR